MGDMRPLTGEQVFERWLMQQRISGKRTLTESGARPYRYLWGAWCQWIDTQLGVEQLGQGWADAKPVHVSTFLLNGPTGTRRAGSHDEAAPITETTRRRYWRVLQRIYAFAFTAKLVAQNPAAFPPLQTPPETQDSEVLPFPVWQALKVLDWEILHWTDLRDKALLGLFIEFGLSPGEVINMERPSVFEQSKVGSLLTDLGGRLVIRIKSTRSGPTREFLPSAALSSRLEAWEAARRTLPWDNANLFISTFGAPLTHRTLFLVVAAKLEAAQKLAAEDTRLPAYRGAMVLRNTFLCERLRAGVAPAIVAADAGLKSEAGLRRLKRRLGN